MRDQNSPMSFVVVARGFLSIPCLIAMVGCAGVQHVSSDRDEARGVVSPELRMHNVERTTKTPGTLTLVDPKSRSAEPSAPIADQEPRDASRESLRQLRIPRDLQVQKVAINDCYERALRDDPRLAGTLELAVRVTRDGAVRNVKVRRDTVKHAGLRKCVAHAVAEVRMLPNVEGPEVTYPVIFGGSTSELL
jgi:hypothetical protein